MPPLDYSIVPIKTTDFPETTSMSEVKEILVNTTTEKSKVIPKEDVRFPASQITDIQDTIDSSINELLPILLDEEIPQYIDNLILNDISAYVAANMNDFQLELPNVIQADNTFNFNSLNNLSSNKIISIVGNIDLQGQTIDFLANNVENITLEFNGGTIFNGTMNPNKTKCVFNSSKAFVNVEILGRFDVSKVDIRMLGAKCDGIDGGIGDFTKDDSFAINQSINFSPFVIIPGGLTTIVKKPIVLKSNTELHIEKNSILKAGAASNCTMIKNEAIDFPNDGVGNVIYPNGWIRNKNIIISGKGAIDCNGWYQNRGDDTTILRDNPEIIGTPRFLDGDGLNYAGFAIKLADIDNLEIKDFTIRNPRTYAFCIGGIHYYSIHDIYAYRSYNVTNQDFFHIHGDCFDGQMFRLKGVSGDDFIAVTTLESGALSIRVGDVKRLNIHDITYWGINPNATPENPIEIDKGIEDGFPTHRLLRLSYTNEIIDDVIVRDCMTTPSELSGQIVLSNLPFNSNDNGRNGYGTGKIGQVLIDNLMQTDSWGFIDTSDYLDIDKLTIINTNENKRYMSSAGGLLFFSEAFDSPAATSGIHGHIKNLIIDNYYTTKGYVNPLSNGFINWDGQIDNLYINNFKAILVDGSPYLWEIFIRSNVKNININNSDLLIFNNFANLLNNDCNLFEHNNKFMDNYVENQTFIRAITNTLVLSNMPTNPLAGDVLRKSDGIYQYKNNNWI